MILGDEVKAYISKIEKENHQLRVNINKYETENHQLKNSITDYETRTHQLETSVNEYIDENHQLKTNIVKYETETKQLQDSIVNYAEKEFKYEKTIQILEEKLRLALYRQFCKHSERVIPGQPLLFESEEAAAPVRAEEVKNEDKTTVKEHTRTKRGRKPIADNIPRYDIPIDISEDDKKCACGDTLRCIGEEVVERLYIIPEQVFALAFHIKKYACHSCEGSGDEDKPAVRTGKVPGNIMPGSIATPETLSYIFIKKYCDHVPYYRQEAGFERIGAGISRQNMDHWQIKVCEKLEPLFTLITKQVTEGKVINMDETVMHVLNEPGRENKQQSRMWLARGGPPGKKAVWYEYQETRKAEHIVKLLKGYKGYLQSDGCDSYLSASKELPEVTLVTCFAHVRRKFFEASQISRKSGDAEAALSQIKGIYTIEKELREQLKSKDIKVAITAEEFVQRRKEKCEPILNAFHEWLLARRGKILDSSKLGEAINYALNMWPHLIHYLDDVELTPDNNAAERGIRPFVMGRKNWVMSGSPRGAQSSCRLYSLIESAKENGLNPYQYLRFVFARAADLKPTDDWSALLPWNIKR